MGKAKEEVGKEVNIQEGSVKAIGVAETTIITRVAVKAKAKGKVTH